MTGGAGPFGAEAGPVARSHAIASSDTPGLRLHLRERHPPPGMRVRPAPVLLVHGATIASVLWDAPLPGWSWMDRLARDGFHVFALDLRGYGGSTRPACFEAPPQDNPAYARATDVMPDLADAVEFIRARTSSPEIDLVGGSWGSVICGRFAAGQGRRDVRRLVLYAPLYAEPRHRPSWLDPVPGHLSASQLAWHFGAYRLVSRAELRRRWDDEIPLPDKSGWRPDGMVAALSDPGPVPGPGRGPDGLKVPNGTLVDLCAVFAGMPLYDCASITVPTLLIRGLSDPVSTHGDAERLLRGLGSAEKYHVGIENGAHFMIAERVFPRVHAEIAGFLAA